MPPAPRTRHLASFWMPDQASTYARESDWIFYFVFWVGAFFFALIVGLMGLFVLRYRRGPGQTAEPSPSHNTALEITWTIIPLIIVVVIFILGFRSFLNIHTPPADAYEIQVTGRTWQWDFRYPNGYVDPKLHVPVDRPVKLVLTSQDVIHSLWVPAFRFKRDAVPGRYNTIWFQARQTGTFDAYCAEYCGQQHSQMTTQVIVHPAGGFEAWLAQASKSPLDDLLARKPDGPAMLAAWRRQPDLAALKARFPELTNQPFLARLQPTWKLGQEIYQQQCASCHDRNAGPLLKGLLKKGREQVLVAGQTQTVALDEAYVRESIEYPARKVVQGWDNRMPAFKDRFSDVQLMALYDYLAQWE